MVLSFNSLMVRPLKKGVPLSRVYMKLLFILNIIEIDILYISPGPF